MRVPEGWMGAEAIGADLEQSDLNPRSISLAETLALKHEVDAITAAIEDGRRRVDRQVKTLRILRQIGLGTTASAPFDLVGPIGLHSTELLRPEMVTVLRQWATYFQPDLEDLERFQGEIERGVIRDPRTILDVAEIADDLVDAATAAVERESAFSA